jgi:hypothetical protein
MHWSRCRRNRQAKEWPVSLHFSQKSGDPSFCEKWRLWQQNVGYAETFCCGFSGQFGTEHFKFSFQILPLNRRGSVYLMAI